MVFPPQCVSFSPSHITTKHFQHCRGRNKCEINNARKCVWNILAGSEQCARGAQGPRVCAQWETDALVREMVCPTSYVVGKLRGWQLTLSDRKLKEVATQLSSTYLSLTVEQCWRRPHPSLINWAVNKQAKISTTL